MKKMMAQQRRGDDGGESRRRSAVSAESVRPKSVISQCLESRGHGRGRDAEKWKLPNSESGVIAKDLDERESTYYVVVPLLSLVRDDHHM